MAKHFLYYAGLDTSNGIEQIGVAVSGDLMHWERPVDGPVIPVGSAGDADALQTSNPCVLYENGTFRMWYQGRGRDGRLNICYAESTDGMTWSARTGAVLAGLPTATGYRAGYQQPHVRHDGNTYRMWFTSQDEAHSTISYAESVDGINWIVNPEDVLTPDEAWEGSLLYYPFVKRNETGLEMWYTARVPGKNWLVGRATSDDGVVWKKDPLNPVLPKRLPSRLSQLAAQIMKGIAPRALRAAYGSGSPFVFEEDGKSYMLTHDSGAGHRLSISLYEQKGEKWVRVRHGLLEEGAGSWDTYFQADPFLLTV